jgi:uncharacterized damage-inducible protein DinB
VDRKPPRLDGGEREVLLALLQFQRESVVRKVAGVSDEDAARSPLASGTSLLWLVGHLADAEHLWFVDRFAGLGSAPPPPPAPSTLAEAVDRYRAMWARVDEVLAGAPDLDELCRNPQPELEPVNLRWVLAHLLEETARHAGHADVLAELLDGRTGR